MSGWETLSGTAVALSQDNIDTDQLIPARFMSQPRSAGYGGFLLHDVRGAQASHPLEHHRPQILIAGRNFGSGSSREAAVYALVDFGIRAVFAPSFGDIFAGNAVNNGLLAAQIDADLAADLISALGDGAAPARVDLTTGHATVAGREVAFTLDPVSRQKLINGWDDIDMTLDHSDEISTFRAARLAAHSWALPAI
ncbi:3-isopropylmalate dehydratase small subunit [Sulfitobacter guttiformis]|uniref:3-isopropylmalate dehydratase n=1 Tax=Sulfitobacter guttiformis TaxID=74349 RepID=A0A420DTF1_9RHOB|nr:3-isopropylmalate dehydratase small subunit [Sulfitobacter guttiformis]KIN71048.1 3-isopropylmalate dehydratase, small subunit [Sulfitobacter guttiformis KCTC 32187]RKE97532.1 3-isopropylmalate/(R)-2-methylmalate dehydratase small subunit [Sulfitobacter guttiformis]